MINNMVNKTLITYLVCIQLCLVSSMAHTNILFNYHTIPGGPMHTLNEEEELLLSKEDDAKFENKLTEALDTLDYFSNNYPYTVEQLENYYGIEFDVSDKYDITLKPKYDSHKIFDIDIRKGEFDSQSLLIKLNDTTCFNFDQLKQRFIQDGYEIIPSNVYYFSHFEKIEQIENTFMRSSITVNSYKNIDIGCIEYYFFEHYEIN